MEPQETKHKLLKTPLMILIGIVIIGATGFGVWYWKNGDIKRETLKNCNKSIDCPNSTCKESNNKVPGFNGVCTDDFNPTCDAYFDSSGKMRRNAICD